MTPQNIYDDPEFFAGYAEPRRTRSGLNETIEQPAIWRLMPRSLSGARILDLGCGFGDFARQARARGARAVLRVDVSQRMLEIARSKTRDSSITYRCCSIESFEPDTESFDVVLSSLLLHYVADYDGVLNRVSKGLVAGGRFVFSVEHAICTARATQKWCVDFDKVARHWPVDGYKDEGQRMTKWFVENVVKYHRTLETYVNGLLNVDFRLERLEEPEASAEAIQQDPQLDAHCRRPPYLS
jgi:ubiquinone/menaquinone biosynthesis C-methylase UbiE